MDISDQTIKADCSKIEENNNKNSKLNETETQNNLKNKNNNNEDEAFENFNPIKDHYESVTNMYGINEDQYHARILGYGK